MVEMVIVFLVIVILALMALPATMRALSTSSLRSAGWTVCSFLKATRNTAISEGITVHVRFYTSVGAELTTYRVDPAQGNSRFTAPNWEDVDNKVFERRVLPSDLRWASEGFVYFRPDGSTGGTAVLKLEKVNDSNRYVETTVYGGSGLVMMGNVHDE